MSLEGLRSFADQSPSVPPEAANVELGAHVEPDVALLGPDGKVSGQSGAGWSVQSSVVRDSWSVVSGVSNVPR